MSTFLDSFRNLVSGLGGRKDKNAYGNVVVAAPALRQEDLSELYLASWLAQRIVRKIVDDALSRGFAVDVADDKATGEACAAKLHSLDAAKHVAQAAVWARLFGGGGILLGVNDQQADLAEPLGESLLDIDYVLPLMPSELQVAAYQRDMTLPGFGFPEMYQAAPEGAAAVSRKIHASRVLRFEGRNAERPGDTSGEKRGVSGEYSKGWGRSLLAACVTDLTGYGQSWQGVWTGMQEYSLGVYKQKGLAALISAGNYDAVLKRMENLDRGKSITASMVLDAEYEDYQRVNLTFGGVAEILQRAMVHIAAAADMPVAILFGQAASGLAATGDGDARTWAKTVGAYRDSVIIPAMEQLAELVFRSTLGPTKGKVPDVWSVTMPPLWEPSEKESADARYVQAQTDQIYIANGVLTSSQVALSRFAGEEYSAETQIEEADIAAPSDTTPA